MSMRQEPLLTIDQAAAAIACSVRTLEREIAAGLFAVVRLKRSPTGK